MNKDLQDLTVSHVKDFGIRRTQFVLITSVGSHRVDLYNDDQVKNATKALKYDRKILEEHQAAKQEALRVRRLQQAELVNWNAHVDKRRLEKKLRKLQNKAKTD